MEIIDLGLIRYDEASELQYALVDEISQGAEDRLLLLEHPPVITFGRHGGEEFLLAGEKYLRDRGVEVAKSTRGGKITCHYPGQLVVYPVLNMARWNKSSCALTLRGLHGLYFGLEEVVIRSMRDFGLEVARREGFPGVWTVGAGRAGNCGDNEPVPGTPDGRAEEAGAGKRVLGMGAEPSARAAVHGKICSIGTAVRRGVTYHGIALNVAADTSLFDMITLCGLPDARPVSLSGEIGRDVSVREVKDAVRAHFVELFV